jgi:carbonic anhydrase
MNLPFSGSCQHPRCEFNVFAFRSRTVECVDHGSLSRSVIGDRPQTLVDNILPGLLDISSQVSEEEQLTTAVEANVRWSIHQILETEEGQNAMKAGFRLMGAVYEIASGRVRFLS